MYRRFFILFSIFLIAGCDINRKNLIVQKRVHLKGYYVHIPGKRSTDPLAYLPPSQFPTINTIQVADRPDKTTVDSVVVFYTTSTSNQPTGSGNLNGNIPTQQQGIGVGVPIKDSTNQSLVIIQPNKDSALFQPINIIMDTIAPMVFVDTINPVLPLDTFLVYKEPRKNKRAHFPDSEIGVFAQAGLLASTKSYGEQVKWNSFSFSMGIRDKIKMNSTHSLVTDIGYRFNQYYIGQHEMKIAPLTQNLHTRERVSINNFSGTICDRIRLVPSTENTNEKWMDIGMYADWSFRTSNVFIDHFSEPNSPIGNTHKIKTKITYLNFLSSWDYGVTARFSLQRFNVFAMYGLNQLIKPNITDNYHDFPRLLIGVEWEAFNN